MTTNYYSNKSEIYYVALRVRKLYIYDGNKGAIVKVPDKFLPILAVKG